MSKLEGISYLKKCGFQIPELLNYHTIINSNEPIKEPLSLRLSSKHAKGPDVYLPSIHNCIDREKMKDFYEQYHLNYDIIVHKTVNPNIIGSISKYFVHDSYKIIIETYKDFIERKQSIIDYREIYSSISGKFWQANGYETLKYNYIIGLVNKIPYDNFDIEFVIEKDKLIFTDFYSKDMKISNKKI